MIDREHDLPVNQQAEGFGHQPTRVYYQPAPDF